MKMVLIIVSALIITYLLLLIPDSDPVVPESEKQTTFAWNQNSYWDALEKQFVAAKKTGCTTLNTTITTSLKSLHTQLDAIEKAPLPPTASQFKTLEVNLFQLAPMVAACSDHHKAYIELFTRLRRVIKDQSTQWDMTKSESKQTIYRLLYGGRAAVEEMLLQGDHKTIPALTKGTDEPSQTPHASILGVNIHSGDLLLSRGDAATSALIARGSDYQGNFSHVAIAHVDPKTHLISMVEAHIKIGVAIATIDQYMKDKKLRVMVLRPRADLPAIKKDPMLPHKAATAALKNATSRHIPYDFAMDYKDHSKLFCSEVASMAYEQFGITLWMGISTISAPGMMKWLSLFGVKNFKTQEPSDLEYDPQLRVVAEWRDPDTLLNDHIDNAIVEIMLERAEAGKKLTYNRWMLPIARVVKGYSMIKNMFGGFGKIPEGMSATAGLRNEQLTADHQKIKNILLKRVEGFKKEHGYTATYFQMIKLARQVMDEMNY